MANVNEQAQALGSLDLNRHSTEESDTTSDSSKDTVNKNNADDKTSRRCGACRKTEEELGASLLNCAKCRSTQYCNKECQRKDWKMHKLICGEPKDAPETPTGNSTNPLFDLLGGSALHQLPEKEVYTYLIDSYRMRVEDDYVFTGEISYNSLYGGGQPINDFRRFLNMAEKRRGLLPSWWSVAKRRECEKVAVDESGWSCLAFAVEKSDIQEHYGNPMMPMQLRVFAEKVYGKPVY